MDTSREDVGIAIRSALIQKGTQQRFSLFALISLSILLLFIDTISVKPLNYFRSFVKDAIYRGSAVVVFPSKSFHNILNSIKYHVKLSENYSKLETENLILKNQVADFDYLKLENTQLKNLIDDQVESSSNLVSSRVMLDKQSPYLNSFVINSGNNKKIKNGMAVLEGKNFIGRIVDVNFFSSRVLLVTDLNSKIPVIIEPKGYHAILNGRGDNFPTLEYLPEDNLVEEGNSIYTSGTEGIFSPGISVGKVKIENGTIFARLNSNLNQITFVNIVLGK